ncbi:hypothetical protein GGS23DRAFT_598363 [Durotheca rogersii]|uniref:uncharacterized protein n=1 Tax=Durotheca rogersii TaxID=419775 RepID=UPI002220C013|nr:uncharacterized protein GGS23DRAFT_598363 [Durotheca rogersii]KAI5861584.1 hypothetical protein GGS23DRAFT_598363 [Durotheca rogersii]
MTATPLILCGHSEDLGNVFKEVLQPDYEVVHFVSSPKAGLVEIPLVLKGEIPTPAGGGGGGGSRVGTGNLALGAPRAVVVGAAYDDAWVASLRKDVAAAGLKAVPVLKPEAEAPYGLAPAPRTPDAVRKGAARAARALRQLEADGKLDPAAKDEPGVYVY